MVTYGLSQSGASETAGVPGTGASGLCRVIRFGSSMRAGERTLIQKWETR
ncbi:MAG TPA: hypothetical protein VEH06_07285 [Candidatus Bathyarchaeia archaeon]|nr:hypothetical protein [Candidatus Bathyarchaeia archaeon]